MNTKRPCPACGMLNPPRFSRCRNCSEPLTTDAILRDILDQQ